MDVIVLLLKQNILMLLYLFIGYFLFRKKLITKQGSADVGRLVVFVLKEKMD